MDVFIGDENAEQATADDNINEKEAEEEKEVEPIEEEPKTDEELVTEIISEELGEESNNDNKVIDSLNITASESEKIISVNLNADENLTTNMTRDGMLSNSGDLFKALFKDGEVVEVNLLWQLPLQDEYGNVENGVVVRLGLLRETFDKINFDNFDFNKYENIADQYFIHQALSE